VTQRKQREKKPKKVPEKPKRLVVEGGKKILVKNLEEADKTVRAAASCSSIKRDYYLSRWVWYCGSVILAEVWQDGEKMWLSITKDPETLKGRSKLPTPRQAKIREGMIVERVYRDPEARGHLDG